jgi:rhodanese-related sulfurtransferase
MIQQTEPLLPYIRKDGEIRALVINDRSEAGIPTITNDSLHALLNNDYEVHFKVYIVDCRFAHEFEAGHIRGALNVTNPKQLLDLFLIDPDDPKENPIIVFHCEYSQKRGPKMASIFRDLDRRLNLEVAESHPLDYEHIAILEGGFKGYVSKYGEDVEGEYVPMLDAERVDPRYSKEASDWDAGQREYEKWKVAPLKYWNGGGWGESVGVGESQSLPKVAVGGGVGEEWEVAFGQLPRALQVEDEEEADTWMWKLGRASESVEG